MFILASSSPRRQQLFGEYIKSDYTVIVSHAKEEPFLFLPYKKAVKEIAYAKTKPIARNHPYDVVIGADTIVVLNKKIIGKPKDEKDAYNILKSLSGKKHKVLTNYCIMYKGEIIQKTVTSKVYFNVLTDHKIKEYIATKKPLDKAGAYGVQDKEFNLVRKVKGSVNNVIGFPVEEILKTLHHRRII